MVKLTKKTAETLIRRYFRGAVVVGEHGNGGARTYRAKMDDLCCVCANDWITGNGKILLILSDSRGNGAIKMYFDPKTLKRVL